MMWSTEVLIFLPYGAVILLSALIIDALVKQKGKTLLISIWAYRLVVIFLIFLKYSENIKSKCLWIASKCFMALVYSWLVRFSCWFNYNAFNEPLKSDAKKRRGLAER